MTATILNPWLDLGIPTSAETYSEAAHSHASDAGAAPDPGRSSAAPVIAARTDVLQTVAATVSAGDEINHIHEIFHVARKLLAEDSRRAENFVDFEALEQSLAEPLPIFLRDDGYLKRRA